MHSQSLAIIIKSQPQTLLQLRLNSTSNSNQFLLKINLLQLIHKLNNHFINLLPKTILTIPNINNHLHLPFQVIIRNTHRLNFIPITSLRILYGDRLLAIFDTSKSIILGSLFQNTKLFQSLKLDNLFILFGLFLGDIV